MATCSPGDGNSTTAGETLSESLADVSKKKNFKIYSYITDQVYDFEAYIYKFDFSFKSDIQAELPFGRSSRIYTYGGTHRGDLNINFFELVRTKDPDAVQVAYRRATEISRVMYPKYSDVNNTLTLTHAPLVRIFSSAFITNGYIPIDATDGAYGKLDYGLLGYISSLTINIDRSEGGAFEFPPSDDSSPFGATDQSTENAALAPKINYSLTFMPIEDKPPGWTGDQWSAGADAKRWPMGFETAGPEIAFVTNLGNVTYESDSADVQGTNAELDLQEQAEAGVILD